jgi:hypothetical protein
MLAGTQYFKDAGEVRDQEIILRWMAREGRMRRRMLSETLLGAMELTEVGQLRRRLVMPHIAEDPFWVFVVAPRPANVDYEQYRVVRSGLLRDHCMVVKYLHPSAEDVVTIGVEPRPEEISEDALYLDARSWNAEAQARARELHEVDGIFESPTFCKSRDWEFPVTIKPYEARSKPTNARKQRRRAAKAARRKNRRR